MDEGKITNRQDLGAKGGETGGLKKASMTHDEEGDEALSDATPQERSLLRAVDVLKGTFPSMEKALGSGSDEKTGLIQIMTRHILEQPRDAVMEHEHFSAYMSVLGKTVGDKSSEVSYVSMICLRVVVKRYCVMKQRPTK